MILSLLDYVKISREDYLDYILIEGGIRHNESIEPAYYRTRLVKAGMIQVAGDFLGGSYKADNKFWGMFRLTDHSFEDKLKTTNQIDLDEYTSEQYSAYTFSNIEPVNYARVEKVLGKGWNLVRVYDSICGRSELTHEELKRCISFYGREAYNKSLNNLTSKLDWKDSTPSKEFPVKLYFSGNDDTSYVRLFPSVEEANDLISEMDKNPPDWEFTTKHMHNW